MSLHEFLSSASDLSDRTNHSYGGLPDEKKLHDDSELTFITTTEGTSNAIVPMSYSNDDEWASGLHLSTVPASEKTISP